MGFVLAAFSVPDRIGGRVLTVSPALLATLLLSIFSTTVVRKTR